MLTRKTLYVVLGAAAALVLLFGGLGASVVFAQEATPEGAVVPGCGLRSWGRGAFGSGGGEWTMFDKVADVLGLTPEDLFSERRAGKTLEELTEEQGVDLEKLQDALDDAREEAFRDRIAQAVRNEEMSEAQADWLLEGLDEGYLPRGGFMRHGRGLDRGFGHGMRGGFGGFAPQRAPQSSPAPDTSSL